MTLLITIFSFALPFSIGYTLVNSFFAPPQKSFSGFLLLASLAVITGMGISSSLFFLSLIFNLPLWLEITAEIIFLLACLYVLLKKNVFFFSPPRFYFPEGITGILLLIFTACFINMLLNVLFIIQEFPHGAWDALAIWNLRAKFLFFSDGSWKDGFTAQLSFSHPDYPLLHPAFIARCWKYIQHDSIFIPIICGGIFPLGIILLLYSALAVLKDKSQALLSGIVITATPFLVERAAFQQADIPLAFLFLATLVLLACFDMVGDKKYSVLVLAGLTMGMAGWTKNEGLLFIVAILLSRFIVLLRSGWKMYWRQLKFLLAGLIPMLLLIFYFKFKIAPPNDITSGWGESVFGQLTDFSRYQITGKYFYTAASRFGKWFASPVLLFLIYPVFIGTGIVNKKILVNGVMVLILMLCGYFLVYITTPYNVEWHLSTSLNRLFLQLYPVFLFYYFFSLKSPRQVFEKKRES